MIFFKKTKNFQHFGPNPVQIQPGFGPDLAEMLKILCFFEKKHEKKYKKKLKLTFFTINIDSDKVEPLSSMYNESWHYPTNIGVSRAIANYCAFWDFLVLGGVMDGSMMPMCYEIR